MRVQRNRAARPRRRGRLFTAILAAQDELNRRRWMDLVDGAPHRPDEPAPVDPLVWTPAAERRARGGAQ